MSTRAFILLLIVGVILSAVIAHVERGVWDAWPGTRYKEPTIIERSMP